MTPALMILIDLVAVLVLAFGVYLPRHRRTDLLVAFIGVNVGVLAVTMVLANSTVSAGLGLGLFGVLSIIRLRSSEISHAEIAYLFVSLSIGLITGMSSVTTPLLLALVVLLVGVLAVVDSPRLTSRYSQVHIQLDRAITDPDELHDVLTGRLGAEVLRATVLKVDLVNDLTLVEVRTRTPRRQGNSPQGARYRGGQLVGGARAGGAAVGSGDRTGSRGGAVGDRQEVA